MYQVHRDVKAFPLAADHLWRENAIAVALSEFSASTKQYGEPRVDPRKSHHYEGMTLVTQFMDFHAQFDELDRTALVGRVRSGFSNPDDLRGLRFEWLIALHASRQGFDVTFPKQTGSAIYDICATKEGVTTEIECKSISNDRGRQIHLRDALSVHELIRKACSALVRGLKVGLSVRILVSARLPALEGERAALVKRVHDGILLGGWRDEHLEIRVSEFDVAKSPFTAENLDQQHVKQYLHDDLGIDDRPVLITYQPSRRALVVSLESLKADDTVGAALDRAQDAYKRQLSGKNPGAICLKFEDLTAEQLRELGAEKGEPTALRKRVSAFLNQRQQGHLVCLGFFADGQLTQSADGGHTREGANYFFEVPTSPMFNQVSLSAFRTGQ